MARDYAKVSARFWTGDTGRQLRALGAEAQVVALYLVTCPSSNMVGLYYLPLPVLVHETGLTREGASKALRSLGEVGFAHYDDAQEVVWVPEMACHQIGAGLQPNDNQVKGVVKAAAEYRKSRFYGDFLERYRAAYHIKEAPKPEAPPKALPSASQAPSKPLRSQEQEQEQEQEQKAAAARASARDGAIPMLGPGVAEAAPPPPAAEAAPGPAPTSVPEAPLAAPDHAPEAPPSEGAGKAGSDQQASTRPLPPDDDVPRRPLRLVDTSDLGPLGAEWRADMERASGWKIVLAAVGRRDQVRFDLEAACEALGLERAVAVCQPIVERRKRHGLGPPGSWAFFLPALQDAVAGKELMPPEARVEPLTPGAREETAADGGTWLFTRARWEPLAQRLGPLAVEQLRAEIGRMVAAVESEGLWTSARNAKLAEVEEFLWTKWSGRAAAGGG